MTTERTGGRTGARARQRLLDAVWGLLLAVTSVAAGITLFVLALVSVALVGVGVGLVLVPLVLPRVRLFTTWYRRAVRERFGVHIPSPYRPEPPLRSGLLRGSWQRTRWLLTDPATWRDLLWLLVNAPVGLVLGLLPVALVGGGLEALLVAPVLSLFTDYHFGLGFVLQGPLEPLLAVFQGLVLLPVGVLASRWALPLHVRFGRVFLAPSRQADLAGRVRHLTETRAETVDAQAAELRRIERDLHDGAQARLVALGMNLGMAEELFATDPELARRLVTDARVASGQALRELRDLVRGIHPPVLAERGLDGAVRALALALPLPVDVDIALPGRLSAPVESAAYFATVETLANAVRHARAGRVTVGLRHADGALLVRVEDDGVGGADPAGGTGLTGIGRRLAAFDGTLAVSSPAGGPTVVTMTLPCEVLPANDRAAATPR